MSHHSDEMSLLRDDMRDLLGATGRYPHGRIAPHDAGEIRFSVIADVPSGRVIVDFGKPIRSVGLTTDQAVELATLIHDEAWKVRGIAAS